jgi:thiamine biosynthesis lipoprotein
LNRYITAALSAALLTALTSCAADTAPPTASERDVFAMDTFMTMKAYGDGADKALEAAEARIHELEDELSVTKSGSDLARINSSGGEAVAVSDDAAELIKAGVSYFDETSGALDISVYPVLAEWGFTTGEYRIPDEGTISRLLAKVNAGAVTVEGSSVRIPEGSMIDLGALAKGYTGDEIMAIFRENGVKSAMVSLGGNVQALGSKPDGSDWRVGIKDPFTPDTNMCVVSISDRAVVTSGNYERYFTGDDGKNYWHIIDPADGHPADNGLVSVTVIGESGLRCDALSTALFVMGTDRAQTYLRDHTDVDAVLVTEDGTLLYTGGISGKLDNTGGRTAEVIARD